MPVFHMDQHIATYDMFPISINYQQDEPKICEEIIRISQHVVSNMHWNTQHACSSFLLLLLLLLSSLLGSINHILQRKHIKYSIKLLINRI
jgi:hypothetical protein